MNVNHIYRGGNPGGCLQTAEYPVEAPRQVICLCLSVNEDVLVIFTQTHVGVQFVMVLPVFGRNRPEGKILETVGVFEAVKQHGKYETGQVRHRLALTFSH